MHLKTLLITAFAVLGPIITIAAPASNDAGVIAKRDGVDARNKRAVIGGDIGNTADKTVDGVLSTGAEAVDGVTGNPEQGVDKRDTSEEPFTKRQNQEDKNLLDALATFIAALKVFADALATIQATLLKAQQQNGSPTNPIYAATAALLGTLGTLAPLVSQALNLAGQLLTLLQKATGN